MHLLLFSRKIIQEQDYFRYATFTFHHLSPEECYSGKMRLNSISADDCAGFHYAVILSQRKSHSKKESLGCVVNWKAKASEERPILHNYAYESLEKKRNPDQDCQTYLVQPVSFLEEGSQPTTMMSFLPNLPGLRVYDTSIHWLYNFWNLNSMGNKSIETTSNGNFYSPDSVQGYTFFNCWVCVLRPPVNIL